MDSIVDTEKRHRGFERALQALHFAHCGLKDAGRHVVSYFAVEQIKSVTQEDLLWVSRRRILAGVMVRAQLGNEIGRVLRSVDS